MLCSSSTETFTTTPVLTFRLSRPDEIIEAVEAVRHQYEACDDPLSLKISPVIHRFLICAQEQNFEEGLKIICHIVTKILICNIDCSFVEEPIVGKDNRIWKRWVYEDCSRLCPEYPYFEDPPLVHEYGSAVGHLLVKISSLCGSRIEALIASIPSPENAYLNEESIKKLPDNMKRSTYVSRLKFMILNEKNQEIVEVSSIPKEELLDLQAKSAATAKKAREGYARQREKVDRTVTELFEKLKEQAHRHEQQKRENAQKLADLAEEIRENEEKRVRQAEEFNKRMDEERGRNQIELEKSKSEAQALKNRQAEIQRKLATSDSAHATSLLEAEKLKTQVLTTYKENVIRLRKQLDDQLAQETKDQETEDALLEQIIELTSALYQAQLQYNHLESQATSGGSDGGCIVL